MKDFVICYAEGRPDGKWEAVCVDFDIAVEADSLDAVFTDLGSAIDEYLEYVKTLPENERARMLHRGMPFERLGIEGVKAALLTGGFPQSMNIHAIEWVGEREKEVQRRTDELRAEEVEIAKSARDAAFEANTLAASANEAAREANEIAREASASARRSAEAAHTNNIIATIALIAAVIAIAISIIGVFLKR